MLFKFVLPIGPLYSLGSSNIISKLFGAGVVVVDDDVEKTALSFVQTFVVKVKLETLFKVLQVVSVTK